MEQDLEEPLLPPRAFLGVSKCVNTQADCVDTTGYCFRTGFWDSELVSTHGCTMSTPQADCVETTGYCFRTGFWDSELVSTHSAQRTPGSLPHPPPSRLPPTHSRPCVPLPSLFSLCCTTASPSLLSSLSAASPPLPPIAPSLPHAGTPSSPRRRPLANTPLHRSAPLPSLFSLCCHRPPPSPTPAPPPPHANAPSPTYPCTAASPSHLSFLYAATAPLPPIAPSLPPRRSPLLPTSAPPSPTPPCTAASTSLLFSLSAATAPLPPIAPCTAPSSPTPQGPQTNKKKHFLPNR
ncbi:hypothetical protein Taro_011679 [Colocasia esculenta]|uniref:Uncharacterized protein n=1 Tax=Colocasia esculenta TaxID=4460 RepID=A0A843U216_COLES|nr:hypothetical protein [Colocasia esculenta]